ncbi:MAG: coproporphyrinogen III oxidase family protein [Deltaproteobacteria bacterium]|nr:coproporphyrinogen III oxidase family protein [Deltaproteobacteria bacterium]MCB9487812.1 coproporphyrinogen III oxidase family protein [Deltaproteobacteria bacterium]
MASTAATMDAELIAQAQALVDRMRPREMARAGMMFPGEEFVPVVSYPDLTMYPEAEPDALLSSAEHRADSPTAAYVHIPFCANRCAFCHWVLTANAPTDRVDAYLDVLAKEMDLATRFRGQDRIPVNTALFGGGTPSYLTPRQLERVMNDFVRHFDLSACDQFSFEAEPASLLGDEGAAKLRILKDYGVHRISLGVQSFDPAVLKIMARPHDRNEALEAIAAIKNAGFESTSIDLIYGYPEQSVQSWIETMRTAVASGADAWHLYRLRIRRYGEKQGVILRQFHDRPDAFPEVDRIRLMKALGYVISENFGYKQHFSRIFATDKRHISGYMVDYATRMTDVIGLGPSSWSNHYRTFTQNLGADFAAYEQSVKDGRLPIFKGIYRDDETEMRRCFISPLKHDRVYKAAFKARTGVEVLDHYGAEIERLAPLGLIDQDDESIFMTERGRFFGDEVAMQFFQRRFLPVPDFAHDLMPA